MTKSWGYLWLGKLNTSSIFFPWDQYSNLATQATFSYNAPETPNLNNFSFILMLPFARGPKQLEEKETSSWLEYVRSKAK